MLDVILDTLLDGVKLLPFLFLTYLAMEWLENKADSQSRRAISRAGRFGPIAGGALGVVPQCGFSAAAANLFAGRVITPGTLIAIFLSTSDEMLPIFISEQVAPSFILKVLLGKMAIGILFGLLVDFVYYNVLKKKFQPINICHICEKERCHCHHEHRHEEKSDHIKAPVAKKEHDDEEHGILLPALKHSLQIFAFILLFSFLLNLVLHFIGEDQLKSLVISQPYISEFITGLVGLIPNCAASVVITELYLEGIISAGALMSGLLVGAGVGLLVLFRINDRLKENFLLLGTLYGLGVFAGLMIEIFI